MKYRLSTLLLTIALIAAITGWIIERRYYANRLVEETEREGAISSTLSTALFTNMIYTQLDILSDDEFARKRKFQLINNVVFLYLHKDNAIDRTIVQTAEYTQRKEQTTALLREAGKSLALLGVENTNEFAESIRSAGFVEEWTDGLLDSDGTLKDALSQFVANCINYHLHNNLSFQNNRTTDETFRLAETALKLYNAGIVDSLSNAQYELEQMAEDPGGRKTKLLQQIESAQGF